MLKIRDDVDLNILKKYGFEYIPIIDEYCITYIPTLYTLLRFKNKAYTINIEKDTRIIHYLVCPPYWLESSEYNRCKLIKKLEKVNLVERISDSNEGRKK